MNTAERAAQNATLKAPPNTDGRESTGLYLGRGTMPAPP